MSEGAQLFDIYCEKCNNVLDITRNIPKVEINTETPIEVSSDNNQNIDYEQLLKKIEANEKLTSEELNSIDIKELVKNEYYKKISKKGEIKKTIMDLINDMKNSDENVQSYMICKNCGFSKSIEPRFRILSKNTEGEVATHDSINDSSYRVKVHIRTMPITRNFNCPNPKCPSHKSISPEAIFFRKNNRSHEIIYVCKRCLQIKIN
jgi:hypothetical protein